MLNNMKKYTIAKCVFITLILLLSSCDSVEKTVEPIQDLLTLEYEKGPEIHEEEVVIVDVWNGSKECIVFPLDFGLKLYSEINGEVLEIGNRTIYIGKNLEYLYPKKKNEEFISIMFSPDLSEIEIDEPINFYAVITGHLCDDETVVIIKEIPFTIIP